MPITRTYTITDLLAIGSTVDLTHYRTSINDDIRDIEYISSNIFDDYMEEIMQMCVEVRLTDEEYSRFRFRPKLLAYHLYKSTDLAFILSKVNNVVSDKDFDFRILNVVRPDMIDQIYKIYEEEKRYLKSINIKNILSIDEFYYSEEGRISDELDRLQSSIPDIIIGDDGNIIEIPSGGGTPGGGSGIDIERYNELLQMIKYLEKEIESVNNNIAEILEKLISEDIETIINELIENKLKEKLNDIESRVNELEGKIPDILDNKLKSLNDAIDDILDRLSKIEEWDLSGGGIKTRDVVIKMDGKFKLGVVEDTEFRVPYEGNIISATVSINTASKKTSNVIFVLQIYDEEMAVWYDRDIMDLQADVLYDTFSINRRIDKEYIRIYIKSGNVENIKGASIIFTILEDSIAEEIGRKNME